MKREYTWWLKCAYKVKTGLMWPSMHEWGLHFLSIQIAQRRMVHTLYWMCIQWLASCLIAQRTIPFHIHSISIPYLFHIRHFSILNGLCKENYPFSSTLNPYWMACGSDIIPHWMGGQQTPNVHCLFLFKWYIHSFILNSARGSEMNGGRQTPNVHCLFLYRSVG